MVVKKEEKKQREKKRKRELKGKEGENPPKEKQNVKKDK